MRRFSLRSLLIGIAIVSALLAAVVPFVKWFYISPQAERNLGFYRSVSGTLIDFIDRHGRWPRDEQELMNFTYEGVCSVDHRREEPFERAVVAYDFDFDRDSLAPEEFRGLRYRYPIDVEVAEAVRDELLTQLAARREGSPPPPRYLTYIWNPVDRPPPSAVGQAVPDDAGEASAGDEEGSRGSGASENEAAAK